MHFSFKKFLSVTLTLVLFLGLFYIQAPKVEAASVTVKTASDYNSKLGYTYRTNCVKFARYMVPSLPTGLTSWSSKKAIINSKTAVEGSVAIVKTSNVYGHVAYVEKVKGNTITTLDGNWGSRIVRRTGTASALGIVGYYVPKNLKTQKITTKSVTPSIKLATSKNYSTSKGVAVYSQVTKNSKDKVTSAGLYLWKKGTKKPSSPTTSEKFSSSQSLNKTTFTIYYRPGIAFGKKLKSDTTYNYQIYAVVGGKKITTKTGTITTK